MARMRNASPKVANRSFSTKAITRRLSTNVVLNYSEPPLAGKKLEGNIRDGSGVYADVHQPSATVVLKGPEQFPKTVVDSHMRKRHFTMIPLGDYMSRMRNASQKVANRSFSTNAMATRNLATDVILNYSEPPLGGKKPEGNIDQDGSGLYVDVHRPLATVVQKGPEQFPKTVVDSHIRKRHLTMIPLGEYMARMRNTSQQ